MGITKEMMMKTKRFTAGLLFSLAALLSGCQQHALPPQAELSPAMIQTSRIIATADGRMLTPQALLEQLSTADRVIVGEVHNEPDHHLVEQWLIEGLAAKRPQGSVLMEMINNDQQSAVNDVRQALKANTYLREQRIQELLQWRSGWPWPLYRGVVLSALNADAPLLAANLSRQQIAALYADPQFPAGSRSAQPVVQQTLAATIVDMHGGQMEPAQLKSMLSVQQNRDRFMAQQLLQAPRPALLIAGGYHAAKNIGVPLHMEDLQGVRPQVLILAATGTRVTADEADYVWYLPATAP